MDIDHPQSVGKYADMLKVVALNNDLPQVLFRHFATQALLICAEKGGLTLPESTAVNLGTVNFGTVNVGNLGWESWFDNPNPPPLMF